MAIVQISKIQQRSGNLVDLPQLDEAEFGWASDAKRLFIGKTVPNENIEVLTAYSDISFNQITGAVGNLNITAVTAENGQVLTYDGTNWVNRGATSGGLIDLGDASNVKIGGGSIGYVLETDGTGNLSWTPKSAIVAYISNVTQANPGVVTTTLDNYLTGGAEVTITEVVGMTQLNGNIYYADVLTANTFALYSDSGLTTPVDTSLFTAYVSNGRIVSSIGGSGTTAASGSNTTVQFNNNNLLAGSADFTWNFATNILSINGNANISNVNATTIVNAPRLISNIATGTAPLTVSSTTRVANLNVAYANVSDFNVVTAQTTGTYYPVFVSGSSTANYALAANSGISVNVATGALSATLLTGTLTTAAQPNITSVGTLTSLSMGGHIIPTANITYDLGNNTNRFRDIYLANSTIYLGDQTISGNASAVTISGTLYANISGNATTAGTVTTASQPNITSVGTLTSLNVSGTITGSNLVSNVSTGTAPLTVTSTTRVSNLNVSYSNVSDYVVVTSQNTGTYYPAFVSGSSSANYALAANSGISANLANGSITATTFVGNVTGNISGNIAVSGSNTQVLFNDSGNANASAGMTFNKTSNVFTVGNTVSATLLTGTLTTAAQPNITSVGTLSSLSVTGNITGGNLLGALANGTSNVNIPASNGNVNVSVGGTANVLVVTSTGANVTGVLDVSANVVPLGIKTDNYYYANGVAITFAGAYSNSNVASYLPTYTGQVGTGAATFYGTTLTTGANTTAGTITGNWSLSAGSLLQSTYADLAEYYTSDLEYPPGTVVEFGGDAEVTLASDGSTRVAGVVSTNPAYAMNAKCEGDYVVALALQGRVPCKVRGYIRKGDMMISGGNGYARPSNNPSVGSVIGKALENYNGDDGIIEVAVGRL